MRILLLAAFFLVQGNAGGLTGDAIKRPQYSYPRQADFMLNNRADATLSTKDDIGSATVSATHYNGEDLGFLHPFADHDDARRSSAVSKDKGDKEDDLEARIFLGWFCRKFCSRQQSRHSREFLCKMMCGSVANKPAEVPPPVLPSPVLPAPPPQSLPVGPPPSFPSFSPPSFPPFSLQGLSEELVALLTQEEQHQQLQSDKGALTDEEKEMMEKTIDAFQDLISALYALLKTAVHAAVNDYKLNCATHPNHQPATTFVNKLKQIFPAFYSLRVAYLACKQAVILAQNSLETRWISAAISSAQLLNTAGKKVHDVLRSLLLKWALEAVNDRYANVLLTQAQLASLYAWQRASETNETLKNRRPA